VTLLLVAVGGGLGALARYVAGHMVDGRMPLGTIGANIAGSFLLGWFSGLGLGGAAFAFLGTGFCGALTTYSSFVVQVHDRGPRLGAAVVVVTVVPALLLCGLGFWLGAT
jgi:CrcB protein